MSRRLDRSVGLVGVRVDNLSLTDLLDEIAGMIAEGGFHQIATANVNFLINAQRDRDLQEILLDCDLVTADGMPVVWSSRWMGTGLPGRVTGADMVMPLARRAAENGWRIYLLGANPANAARAVAVMKSHYPAVNIVGRCSPPVMPLAEMDNDAILRDIERTRPDILLVAFGNPKQEKWISMHREQLRKVPVCIGIGGTLDMISGAVSRAPSWSRRSGTEWLYRISREPKRLLGRYVKDGIGLLRTLPVQLAAATMQRRVRELEIRDCEMDGISVLHLHGDLCGAELSRLAEMGEEVLEARNPLILNMSGVTCLDADGVGTLMGLLRTARRADRELWLAAMPWFVERMLQAARISSFFLQSDSLAGALVCLCNEPALRMTEMGRSTDRVLQETNLWAARVG
jgi:N-acetylglucosaminyldiphosphoundecaprenol N-acetyl-beta-D-mannosaminyltransferase